MVEARREEWRGSGTSSSPRTSSAARTGNNAASPGPNLRATVTASDGRRCAYSSLAASRSRRQCTCPRAAPLLGFGSSSGREWARVVLWLSERRVACDYGAWFGVAVWRPREQRGRSRADMENATYDSWRLPPTSSGRSTRGTLGRLFYLHAISLSPSSLAKSVHLLLFLMHKAQQQQCLRAMLCTTR